MSNRRWTYQRFRQQVQKRIDEGKIRPADEFHRSFEEMAAADMVDDYEAELARLRSENVALRTHTDALRARMRKARAILELAYGGALTDEVIGLLTYASPRV